jgi:hypothetical protein
MATPKKKLPDHVYPHLELAEHHTMRLTLIMNDIRRVMCDERGINPHMLEKLHAKLKESIAVIAMALSLIERQEPLPDAYADNGNRPAVDRAWLLAMDHLVRLTGENGASEAARAFITAKLKEMEI